MTRDCHRCGFTLPTDYFPTERTSGRRWICCDCWSANSVLWRVASIAADGLLRLRAVDALLNLGYVRAAHLIVRGAVVWPSIRELREGTLMPRQPLWWISLDADTIALLRMLLRSPDPARTPKVMCVA